MTDLLQSMMTEEDFLQHMSTLSDELAHYGVKGMKWGVLREKAAAGNKGAAKKLAKADEGWKKETATTGAYINVHNKMAQKMSGKVTDDFNANPKYKNIKDFKNFDDPKVKEYFRDYEKLTSKYFAEATKELYGESPSGRYTCEIKKSSEGFYYAELRDNQAAEHAALGGDFKFKLNMHPDGKISGLGDLIDDTLKHDGMMTKEEFLEHWGVKGMRWGVKKGDNSLNTHTSADAARYNKLAKRLKTKGVDNLSNDDLAKLNKRNQLLSEYKKNNPSKFERGAKVTKTALQTLKTAGVLITAVGGLAGAASAVVVARGMGVTATGAAGLGARLVSDVLRRL